MAESSNADPRNLWQNQPEEDEEMSVKLLLEQAQKLGARARRDLIYPLSMATVALVVAAILVGLALETSMHFYRVELERRYRTTVLFSRPWGIVLLGGSVVAPFLYLGLRGEGPLQNVMPFVFLVVAWMAVTMYAARQRMRRLQREIDEFDAFEAERPDGDRA